jgi:hypothetical protein
VVSLKTYPYLLTNNIFIAGNKPEADKGFPPLNIS